MLWLKDRSLRALGMSRATRNGLPELAGAAALAAAVGAAAAAVVGAAHAGVDLIPVVEGGYSIFEVNSMPAWQGLQSVTEVDVAFHLARDVLARSRPGRPVAA